MKQIVIKKWIDGEFREVKRYSEEEVVSIRHHTDGLEIILKGNIRLYDTQCIIEFEEEGDDNIGNRLLNWFKDCKWDAVDNGTLKRNDIIAWLEKCIEKSDEERCKISDDIIAWLEKKIWKPSDEQMMALRRMKAAIAGEGEIYKPLNSLYEDLKRMRNEKQNKK